MKTFEINAIVSTKYRTARITMQILAEDENEALAEMVGELRDTTPVLQFNSWKEIPKDERIGDKFKWGKHVYTIRGFQPDSPNPIMTADERGAWKSFKKIPATAKKVN